MYRRDFVKLSSLAGLSMFLPATLASQAHAEEATWAGPYFLHMHASGGWDPTIFCDGKVTAEGTTPDYENRLITEIETVNGIPVPAATANGKYLIRANQGADAIEDPVHFFKNVGSKMLVFNGVDTQTNNHDTGVQGFACGNNDVELPAIAALFAGAVVKQRNIPLPFLAHGAYNRTGDVVGISRFPGDKVGLLANPTKYNGGEENDDLLSPLAVQKIIELRERRLSQLRSQATLPRTKRTLNAMLEASKGGTTLSLLKELAAREAPDFSAFEAGLAPDTIPYLSQQVNNGRSRFVDLGGPLETLLRCFQTGVTAAATYSQGGFDTHDNHDNNQQNAMGNFVARLRYVLLRAEQLGLSDKLYVLVTSDFGRTPRYNTGNGKDHWNVTSTLLMAPGIQGGRAIGKTDAAQKAMRLTPGNINEVLEQNDNNGTRIHPTHLHAELRRVCGLDKAEFIGGFPLPAQEQKLPLLA